MIEKLEGICERLDEINQQLCKPEVVADQKTYAGLMREAKRLTPVAEKFRAYKQIQAQNEEARALLDAGTDDRELRELAEAELAETGKTLETLNDELKLLLLGRDENDDKNVIVEIRAGAGGEEAALFAASLFRMYSMYAERKGFKIELLNENATELGGFKEISFMVEGEGAYSRFKFESGVHRVQRVPETESQGRVHTSTATVAVLPEAEEVEFELNPADLQIDVFRSSGAGGQKVNKTSSAIRITHLPTGMVVECQDERSQHKNKDKALKVLRSRLFEIEQAKQNALDIVFFDHGGGERSGGELRRPGKRKTRPRGRGTASGALRGCRTGELCVGYLPALANLAKRRLKESMRPSVSTNVFLPV